jgi:outer membrane receptor protein involved in Fe transport
MNIFHRFTTGTFLLAIMLLMMSVASGWQEPLMAQAQEHGRIVGKVIDSETAEPLIGANVLIEGTMKGSATDVDGRFAIQNVDPGTYTLVVSIISHTRKKIENIEVGPGQLVRLDIVMTPDVIQTEEVVVEARAVLSYEGALLTQQKKASAISDGISAEQIRRAPDANSSDALRRVTGVSIVDNKYVFVRGTPERYSSAMLNGASVASTEPDKKSFAFDLLPSNLMENTVIAKSFTPDMPGDVAGGLVKLNTVDFPPALTARISFGTSYQSGSTFQSFKTYDGGKTDALGIDDGTRSLPASFPRSLGEQPLTAEQLHQHARSMTNSWAPKQGKAPMNTNFTLSLGDGVTLLGNNFGFVTALTYRNNYESSNIERNEYEASGEPRFQYRGGQSTYSVSWGAIGNLSYRVADYHKLSIRNTYTRSAEDHVTEFSGIQHTDIGAEQRHTALRYVERSVYSGQLTGEHFLPFLGNTQLEWRASRSVSARNEPDYRRIVYWREAGSKDPFIASLGFQANLKNGGRFFSDLADKANGFGFDATLPVSSARLKVGGVYDKKTRSFNSRLIGIIVNARGNGFTDADLYALPIDEIFAPENFRRNGFSIDEYRNGTNNYTAGQRTSASYVMMDVPFSILDESFRFIGGARVESSHQNVKSKDLSGQHDLIIDLDNMDVLPSANLVFIAGANANIRVAYSQTVNRPELRELAPFAYFDFNTQTSIRGNEHLQRALIRNYDLRVETFPNAGELLSASLFYKSMTNAIEQVVVTGSALGSERTFMNADLARNYGYELEARIGLGHISDALSNLSLRGNYTRVASEVTVEGTETTIERRNRPLQGQSPYMMNLGLLYENAASGTSVNLLFNRFGQRIIEVSTLYEEDVIEQPRSVVDVVLTQTLFEQYEVKLAIRDVLAQEQVFSQGNKKARGNQKGASYSLGISFKIK